MTRGTPTRRYSGRHLHLLEHEGWEYVTRANATGVVAAVALHDDGRVVLVEQYRTPLDRRVVELPAGLVGDTDEGESALLAAQRELAEETGYTARDWTLLYPACSSPGLTDEAVTIYLARSLTRVGPGGGIDGESITVHEIVLGTLPGWLAQARSRGVLTDMKLLAGVYAASALHSTQQP